MNVEKVVRKAVARGAAYMDATYPGWDQRIDPRRLNLADSSNCILGQINGFFPDTPEVSHSDKWLARRGFSVWTDNWPTTELTDTPWSLLTAEWQRVIRERTFSAAASTRETVQQLQRASKAMRERNMEVWTAIAEWIDTHARDLSLAGGRIDSCDSPDDVRSAIATAQAYLGANSSQTTAESSSPEAINHAMRVR